MARWKYQTTKATLHVFMAKGEGFGLLPEYWSEWLVIYGWFLWVAPGYRHDGCTWAPDFRVTRVASILHDAIYQFADPYAAKSGNSVRTILKIGDLIFLYRMRADRRPIIRGPWWRRLTSTCAFAWDTAVAYTYYRSVRLAGYRYHVFARRIMGPAEHRTHTVTGGILHVLKGL